MNASPKGCCASQAGRVEEESKPDANDERPPICPACGVTMGFIVDEDGTTRDVCLECGFSDEMTLLRATDG
jgi:hypothetical protein